MSFVVLVFLVFSKMVGAFVVLVHLVSSKMVG